MQKRQRAYKRVACECEQGNNCLYKETNVCKGTPLFIFENEETPFLFSYLTEDGTNMP